ncbi:MAG TPA: hypothetical protein VFX98_10660 [Longimicrobiaceae bacterium]|nr:hypothetical protein [Longimicrobiaceae bacterium]
MTRSSAHLPYWTLEQLAEGSLSAGEEARAREHLRGCAACAAELEGARALIAALEGLPVFTPSPAFADAVMARVLLQPALALAPQRARRWLPQTRRGWMLVLGALLVPSAPVLAFLAWLFSHPGMSVGAVAGVAGAWARESVWRVVVQGTEALIRSGLFQWVIEISARLNLGSQELLVGALLLAIAIPASGLAMVRLLRTPMGGIAHA